MAKKGIIKVNSTNRWTDKDFTTLKKLHGKGLSTQEIADEMGRSFYSVSKKVSILGLSKKYNKVSVSVKAEKERIPVLDPRDVAGSSPKGIPTSALEELKKFAEKSGYKVAHGLSEIIEATPEAKSETKIKDTSKKMTKLARQIARANGKRITMALFFVEDL